MGGNLVVAGGERQFEWIGRVGRKAKAVMKALF
jgi:hypothetical protein